MMKLVLDKHKRYVSLVLVSALLLSVMSLAQFVGPASAETVHDVAVLDYELYLVVDEIQEVVIGPIIWHSWFRVYVLWHVDINATVRNEGNFTETFNVTAYYDNTAIGTKTVTDLAPGTNTTVSIRFNLNDADVGTYTLFVNASVVPGEIDTSDNSKVGTIKVHYPGDVNGDGFVGGYDLTVISINWWSKFSFKYPDYTLLMADFNGDGFVGGFDVTVASVNWWQNVPSP